jgi:hypothetical protein
MKSEKERVLEFLVGWMMEFGDRVVLQSEYSKNEWWEAAVNVLNTPSHPKAAEDRFEKVFDESGKLLGSKISQHGLDLIEKGL